MDLRLGADGIEWFATLPHPDGAMRLFEYEYTTGTGKGTVIHIHTIAAWPASRTDLPLATLGNHAGFRASRMIWWFRRLWKKVELTDPAIYRFAKRWALFGDADTAGRFLTPAVRAELANSPDKEFWYIGGGWACCVYQEPLDAANIGIFVGRSLGILGKSASDGRIFGGM